MVLVHHPRTLLSVPFHLWFLLARTTTSARPIWVKTSKCVPHLLSSQSQVLPRNLRSRTTALSWPTWTRTRTYHPRRLSRRWNLLWFPQLLLLPYVKIFLVKYFYLSRPFFRKGRRGGGVDARSLSSNLLLLLHLLLRPNLSLPPSSSLRSPFRHLRFRIPLVHPIFHLSQHCPPTSSPRMTTVLFLRPKPRFLRNPRGSVRLQGLPSPTDARLSGPRTLLLLRPMTLTIRRPRRAFQNVFAMVALRPPTKSRDLPLIPFLNSRRSASPTLCLRAVQWCVSF
jgi:hypothetical protein